LIVTKSKKRGIGINAFFDQAPSEQAEALDAATPANPDHPPQAGAEQSEDAQSTLAKTTRRTKIRNTFVIYEDTMRTLEMLRLLAAPKKAGDKGSKVTYGDLIDEAVQALLEKKSQDEDLGQKLKETLKMDW
jgi:hypothetical protein